MKNEIVFQTEIGSRAYEIRKIEVEQQDIDNGWVMPLGVYYRVSYIALRNGAGYGPGQVLNERFDTFAAAETALHTFANKKGPYIPGGKYAAKHGLDKAAKAAAAPKPEPTPFVAQRNPAEEMASGSPKNPDLLAPEPTKPVGPAPVNVDLLQMEIIRLKRELGIRTQQLDLVSHHLVELTLAADSMLVGWMSLNLDLSTDMRRATSKAATHLAVQIDAARTKGGVK